MRVILVTFQFPEAMQYNSLEWDKLPRELKPCSPYVTLLQTS